MKKRIIAFVLSFLWVLSFCALTTSASAVDLDSVGSLSLKLSDRETKKPIKKTKIRLYFVAYATEKGEEIEYVYSSAFENCGMEETEISDSYFSVHAFSFAQRNNVSFIEKSTDSSGKLSFQNLSCGAYLVAPGETSEGYMPISPFIAFIPMFDEAEGKWLYNISANPKTEKEEPQKEKTYLTVKKLWSDNNHPENVTVALLKNGKEISTVVLDESNNWKHTWNNLEKGYSWSAVELDVPKGYNATYNSSKSVVTIKNQRKESSPPNTTLPQGEDPSEPEELIDTGQLNWPVPIFSVLGILLFSAGWLLLESSKKKGEAKN
ncbi:MAG: Cna B-type domain-containing protein [Clostridia bacterium]|nr:Cna B-type domain-containing protein [Clostridia bacterium]